MSWCAVCCTLHGPQAECPGPLDASGEERQSRRIKAFTDRIETFGVLVAPSGDLWRARIMTFPRTLWCVPGRRDTVKFAGTTPEEAEHKAIAFVLEHCESRGHRVLDRDAHPDDLLETEPAGSAAQPLLERDPRFPHAVPARFGAESPDRPARTINLSRGGLYLATGSPLSQGREVRIVLGVSPYHIPLRGTVCWVHTHDTPTKPAGMGIQLHEPPPMYVRYVRSIQERAEESPT